MPLMAAGGGAGVITVWNLEERRLATVIRDAHDAPLVHSRARHCGALMCCAHSMPSACVGVSAYFLLTGFHQGWGLVLSGRRKWTHLIARGLLVWSQCLWA